MIHILIFLEFLIILYYVHVINDSECTYLKLELDPLKSEHDLAYFDEHANLQLYFSNYTFL